MANTLDRIKQIEGEMLAEMQKRGIEDKPLNRYVFLQGMRESWLEDPSEETPEKLLWLQTVTIEIDRQLFRHMYPN